MGVKLTKYASCNSKQPHFLTLPRSHRKPWYLQWQANTPADHDKYERRKCEGNSH